MSSNSHSHILITALVICIIIFSLDGSIVIGMMNGGINWLTVGNDTHGRYIVAEIDLSLIKESILPSRIIVTVLNGTREIEVPYIIKPIGVSGSKYIIDTLYRGKRITQMSYSEYIDLINRSLSKKINHKYIKPLISKLSYLVRRGNSSRILVYIPANIVCSDIKSYKGWYYYALISNLTHRALFKYDRYVVIVYFNNDSKKPVDREIIIPHDKPNMIINVNVYTGSENRRYILDVWRINNAKYNEAKLVSIEKFNDKNPLLHTLDHYRILWYNRPWRSQGMKKGEITLGELNNKTLGGSYYYYITDSFTICHNTTRYEAWFWLSSDKPVSGLLQIKLGNMQPSQWYINLEPGVLYGYGIIVHTQPEEPGNYLSPGEISAQVSIHVNDRTAKLVLISHVLAKAYILDTSKGFYIARTNLKGIGRLQETSDQDPLDERYDVLLSNEALFGFISASNYVDSSVYPYIVIHVRSSPNQKYDRIVQLYFNGLLVDEKVARNPNIPNGSRGVRSCTFTIEGSQIKDELLSSMKRGVTPIIRVVIKGFQPPDESGIPREEWFVYGHVDYLVRASCIQMYGYNNNNILYKEDPTIKYTGSMCNYIEFTPIRDYNGMQLWSGDTDIMEKYFQISITPPVERYRTIMGIDAVFNPTSIWRSDQNTEGIAFTFHFELRMELYSPIPITDYSHTAYGPSNDKIRELLESIQWGLWVASMAASIISFASGNWIVSGMGVLLTALSYPGLYVYGAYTYSKVEHGSSGNVLIMTIKWGSGWDRYAVAPITGRFSIEPVGQWPKNSRFTLYYEYEAYIEFDDRVGVSDYTRYGKYNDYGYLYFYTVP